MLNEKKEVKARQRAIRRIVTDWNFWKGKSSITSPANSSVRVDWDHTRDQKSTHIASIRTDWLEKSLVPDIPKVQTDWSQSLNLDSLKKIHTDWDEASQMPSEEHWSLPMSSNRLSRNFTINLEQKKFREGTYPLSGEYESEVPAIFLHRLQKLKALNAHHMVIARDGSIPLYYFFQTHKTPCGLRTKIAIEQSFIDLVPKVWQRHIATYRLVSGPNESNSEAVFIYGINSAALVTPELCKSKLLAAKPILDKAKKIYLCLPCHFLSSTEPVKMHTEIVRLILSMIGTDVEIVDWGQFLQSADAKNCQIISLNKRTLISDCWLTHALLKRGSQMLESEQLRSERFVPVSRSHGFALITEPKFPKQIRSKLKVHRSEILSNFENSIFNWQKLFAGTKSSTQS